MNKQLKIGDPTGAWLWGPAPNQRALQMRKEALHRMKHMWPLLPDEPAKIDLMSPK